MQHEILINSRVRPYLENIEQIESLSYKYRVPQEDVMLIGLNLSGIRRGNEENDRGRFILTVPSGRNYRVAMTVTNSPLTHFTHTGESVLLGGAEVGQATEIEKDTCTDSYWRNRTHLTLNSNSRSVCRGCNFCGTYSLERGDEPITKQAMMEKRAIELQTEVGGDFSNVDAIGVVTGCFPNEQAIVNHLKLIREVFSQVGFRGEIQYVGSQLRNPDSIKELTNDGPFALYLTLEVFSRREALMKQQKASLTLDQSIDLLQAAKNTGGESSFLYIAGLDPLPVIRQELPRFAEAVTRFPQLQTYQLYTPDQISLRDPEAHQLDYFLKLRQFTESVFPHIKPVLFHNYRGLWYSEYNGQKI